VEGVGTLVPPKVTPLPRCVGCFVAKMSFARCATGYCIDSVRFVTNSVSALGHSGRPITHKISPACRLCRRTMNVVEFYTQQTVYALLSMPMLCRCRLQVCNT